MALLGRTLRIEAPAWESLEPLRQIFHGPGVTGGHGEPGRPGALLFALWHGEHFPVLLAYRDRGIVVITSQSKDGEILTRILQRFGYRCIRGSSTRGGTRALVDLTRAVQQHHDATLAVDGPKGPRHQVKPGILLLAKLTGCPIVPALVVNRRAWRIRSWDRYEIPKPFSRCEIHMGEPMFVPGDADDAALESLREVLQVRMLAMATPKQGA